MTRAQVLVIPAEATQPCHLETIDATRAQEELLRLVGHGDYVEHAVYDRGSVVWGDEDGAGALPQNDRATAYAFDLSESGRRNRRNGGAYPYFLYGNAVITGGTPDTIDRSVPRRILELFTVTHTMAPSTWNVEL